MSSGQLWLRKYHVQIWHNLRTKLLVVFLSLLLVPIVGMGIHSYFFMSRTVLKKAIEVEQQNLSSQSSHVRSILVETQNTLIYISNLQSMLVLQSSDPTTDIYEASLQVLTYDLQNYIRMYPIVQHLAYYSTTGDPLIAVQSTDTRVPTEKFEEFVAQVLSSPDDTTHIFLDSGEDDNVSELQDERFLRRPRNLIKNCICYPAFLRPPIARKIKQYIVKECGAFTASSSANRGTITIWFNFF